MVSSYIASCLEDTGLGRVVPSLASYSDDVFLSLMMSDYSKIGIQDIEEKQKLFRLIKLLSANKFADQKNHKPVTSNVHNDKHNGLLDLEEQDGDLLTDVNSAFNISPVGQLQQRPKSGHAPALAHPPAYQIQPDEDPPKIRVVVRKRPISRKEHDRGDDDIVDVSMNSAYVIVHETKVKVDLTKYLEKHQFNFDDALDDTVSNDIVYRSTVQPLVGTLFKNGKASCFAYGQTGSGKTYTMSPLPTRAAADIFQYLARPEFRDVTLNVSCFEIYGNKVFDLLNQRKKLNILEDGKRKVVVVGLKEFGVETVEAVKQLIEESSTRRSTGSTAANSDSSRSHSIMQFALKRSVPPAAAAANRFMGEALEPKLIGKISFIDLAGSERGADTSDNNRQTRLEGAEINKSLLALKECIRALDSDARHVPFRGSKLTAVLRDSFVGDQARTVMIANISPCSTSVEHTLNTLRYADRVKELRKDKAERTPGGVTPGDDQQYYAAVQRAGVPAVGVLGSREPSPLQVADVRLSRPRSPLRPAFEVNNQRQQQQQPVQHQHHQRRHQEQQPQPQPQQQCLRNEPSNSRLDDDDAELAVRHDELMDSILVEEENLVTFHRAKLEDDMELMRREMALLQEVDQPGSEIDNYVEQMTQLLGFKRRGIDELKAKLEGFKSKLREEESLSRTVHKQRDPYYGRNF